MRADRVLGTVLALTWEGQPRWQALQGAGQLQGPSLRASAQRCCQLPLRWGTSTKAPASMAGLTSYSRLRMPCVTLLAAIQAIEARGGQLQRLP